MAIVIGIAVGGSTTKIVGIENHKIKSPVFITAADPVTSLFGAFGKYIYDNHIALRDIEQIMLTGVGSSHIEGALYGVPTMKIDEFISNGLGARYESNLDRLLVVSMGTGTSFIKVENDSIKHIGGIGIGGGTLSGLSRLLLKTNDICQVARLAEKGDISKINLQIQDICTQALPDLPLDATASNFGNVDQNAAPEDLAKGLFYLVYQAIGSAVNQAAVGNGIKDVVLIGNLTQLPLCAPVFKSMEDLYPIRFHIPPYAEYCTAIGAALSYIHRK